MSRNWSTDDGFYRRHAAPVLGCLVRRTRDPERALAPLNAESKALGWTTDGQAIVFFPKSACGTEFKPGTYVVSADGKERTRIAGASGFTPPFEPSIQPRDVGEAFDVPAP